MSEMPNVAKDLGIFFCEKSRAVLLLLNTYGLTRKTKGQLSVIDIDNDATSYVVQCFLINYIPVAQAHNARVTRPFYFLKRVGYARQTFNNDHLLGILPSSYTEKRDGL